MSSNAGKKRKKWYYKQCANKKHKRVCDLDAEMRGFLLTCNKHEHDARREAYNLLNEYADKLYGPEQVYLYKKLLKNNSGGGGGYDFFWGGEGGDPEFSRPEGGEYFFGEIQKKLYL